MGSTDAIDRELAGSGSEEFVEAFREAMSSLAAGVVMVTTRVEDRPWGLTVSACCSVSMAPPTLLVSLGTTTASAAAIEASGRFGVSILGEGLIDAARFGSARGAPKFIDEFHDEASDDRSATPVVAGAIRHVDCRVVRVLPVADHTIFLGRVENVLGARRSEDPLVYHNRRWHRLNVASDLGAGPAPDLWW